MDTTLAIIILVAVMYFVIIICAILFIMNKRKNIFTQTIDPKPQQTFQVKQEKKNS
ncbi:hypothetical protein BJ095_101354 [Ureibacillus chungkukjangi]|uniref:YtzI protein n=1 Tax=Ureibacillus chungkukjangi TaxID=1202712 RepID=A0A318U423_9BACL|nr:hypothetical protein BJ095_101354 [Ureibacillus chungkukjangi]